MIKLRVIVLEGSTDMDKAGKNVVLEVSSIFVCEGSGIQTMVVSIKSAVLGKRAGSLMGDCAENEDRYEVNGIEIVGSWF